MVFFIFLFVQCLFFIFFYLLPGAIIQIMHRCERQTGAFKRTDARKEGEGGTDTRDVREGVGRNWSRTRRNVTGVAGLSGGQERESSSNCRWTGPGHRSGRSGPGVALGWPRGIRVGMAALILTGVLRSEWTSDGQVTPDTGQRRDRGGGRDRGKVTWSHRGV